MKAFYISYKKKLNIILILENIDFKINEKTYILIKFNLQKCHKAMQN
jgi:hypothetical protein